MMYNYLIIIKWNIFRIYDDVYQIFVCNNNNIYKIIICIYYFIKWIIIVLFYKMDYI
jgi:hypothetical protein